MVVALGPGRFYGSALPRPRFYEDVKLNDERVDAPLPVLDPLLHWAQEAHWSMGGLSFQRRRLQGRIEGSIDKLRAAAEKISRNARNGAKNESGGKRKVREEEILDRVDPVTPRVSGGSKRIKTGAIRLQGSIGGSIKKLRFEAEELSGNPEISVKRKESGGKRRIRSEANSVQLNSQIEAQILDSQVPNAEADAIKPPDAGRIRSRRRIGREIGDGKRKSVNLESFPEEEVLAPQADPVTPRVSTAVESPDPIRSRRRIARKSSQKKKIRGEAKSVDLDYPSEEEIADPAMPRVLNPDPIRPRRKSARKLGDEFDRVARLSDREGFTEAAPSPASVRRSPRMR